MGAGMGSDVAGFRFGGDEAEYIALVATGRSSPDADDFWDANWILCAVDVNAGAFRGRVDGMIRAEELEDFARQIDRLVASLDGEARCTTMEGWLDLRLVGDGRGHVSASCRLCDHPASHNTLDCRIEADQTYLPMLVRGLAGLIQSFPVLFRDRMP
jgi:hypothetical protein